LHRHEPEYVEEAFRCGADEYVLKVAAWEELSQAIAAVMAGLLLDILVQPWRQGASPESGYHGYPYARDPLDTLNALVKALLLAHASINVPSTVKHSSDLCGLASSNTRR
jgi:DNA-binding NarL/FixJ family response regulator